MKAITRRRVTRPFWLRFGWGNLFLISGRIEKKLWDFQNAQTVSLQCKMRLTNLHDFYSWWHLYICRSLFGHSTFFVASLVFMKGTSCCVKRRNFKRNWAVRSCYGKVLLVIGLHDFRCYLRVASWSWYLCNLPCVYALFWLVSIASCMFVSLQIFAFKGQNMKVTVKMLFTCILRCDAGPGCD